MTLANKDLNALKLMTDHMLLLDESKTETLRNFVLTMASNLNVLALDTIDSVKTLYDKHIAPSELIRQTLHKCITKYRITYDLHGPAWVEYCTALAETLTYDVSHLKSATSRDYSVLDDNSYDRLCSAELLTKLFIANPWYVYIVLMSVAKPIQVSDIIN